MGGRWRGAAVVALGAAVAGWSLFGGHPARAQLDPSTDPMLLPGFGQAVGQLIRIDPSASGLSFGVEIGAAKAGHQQYTSRSYSRIFDAGLIGLSLAAEGCKGDPPSWPMEDQPQAITIDSREEGAAEGETLADPPFERHVQADPSPSAEAYTTSQSLGVPGIIDIGVARSEARSGMLEPGVREAWAAVDIAHVTLLGGAVVLRGLHWESVHRGGVSESHAGSFSLGALEIGGVPVPLPESGDLFAFLNSLLEPLGVRLGEPVAHLAGKIQFVDPLAIIIEPHPTRDSVTGGLLRALHPVREALFDALIAADCDMAPLITVADLLIGSVTGAGTFTIELGGTEATTEPIAPPRGLGAAPGARASTATPAAPPRAGVRTPAAPVTTRPSPVATAGPVEVAGETIEPIAAPVDDPGRDLAAVVGLVTIALGALLVEGDRRTMRRAQRAAVTAAATSTTTEETTA